MKGILDAKTLDDSRTIDEEIYELLKKISKNKEFESKYRDKATVLLDKVLHFNEYREQLILQEAGEHGLTGDAVKNLQNGGRRMGRKKGLTILRTASRNEKEKRSLKMERKPPNNTPSNLSKMARKS